MGLERVLRIGSDGLPQDHLPSVDSIDFLDYLLNGTSLSGVSGATVLGDNSATYLNIAPAGDTIRETLEAIDTALGVAFEECYLRDVYTNNTAGPFAKGDVVYVSGADEIDLAESDDAAKDEPIGVLAEAIIATESGQVTTHGCALGVLVGATAGEKYFLGPNPGEMVTSVAAIGSGQRVVLIGHAKNATDLNVRIQHIGRRP